ncbi:MAG: murein biosynthesis integral membrane protein MurJ [Pseudomonadota bacterium]|nr:murein biosynthesis integral membrane protein MurJ [Pseudomonadota bacterium]
MKSAKTVTSNADDMARQGGVVASMTLLSRISGLMRDVVLSYLFGASQLADMFFVAFRIPNFFRRLFAEGAFNQAFVPVLMQYKTVGHAQLLGFIAPLSGLFATSLAAMVALGVLFAPALAALFAPGFLDQPAIYQQTSDLVRITFPYLGFISLTAYAAALLNAHSHFALPAVTPVMLNLCLMLAAFVAIFDWIDAPSVVIVAWGVMAAGFVQLLMQLPTLARLKLLPRPSIDHRHDGVRQVGKLLLPAVFAASVAQINALVNTILASTLITGSISWLYYADRLLELPVGLVAVALGTVILPHLSTMVARNDQQRFSATLDWGVHLGLMLGLPAAVALWLLAEPLVAVMFASFGGAMTDHDVRMAAAALEMFAVALPGFVLVKVLQPGFFANQDTRTPFRYAAIAVVVNLLGSLATFSWMGHVGLALATALSAWTQALLLLYGLVTKKHYQVGRLLLPWTARVVACSALLALGLGFFAPSDTQWIQMLPSPRVGWLGVIVLIGVLGYAAALFLFGLRPRHLRHEGAALSSET